MLVHAIILALVVFIRVFYNHTRLSSIPGPAFAGISGLWRERARKSPGYSQKLGELHERYGKVVRIGPNVVSVFDPVVITRMYGGDVNWEKSIRDDHIISVPERTAANIHVSNELRNRLVRDTTSRNRDLQQYEGIIDKSARDLISALQIHRVLEITASFQIFASGFAHRTFAETILKENSITGTEKPPSTVEHLLLWSPIVRIKRERQDLFSCTSPRRQSCTASQPGHLHDLEFLDQNGMADQKGIFQEYSAVVEAGIDAISTAFVSTFALLMRYPRAMTRVREEIDTAFYNENLSNPPIWREARRLRYLDAVLKESLRHGTTRSSIEKSVPAGGTTIHGHYLPAGTIVEWQVDALHCDPDIYGDDVEDFRPERWLIANPQKRKRMEQGLPAFNISRRLCVPVRAAWLELKKVAISILLQFNMQLIEANEEYPVDGNGTIEYTPRMMVNFVPRVH